MVNLFNIYHGELLEVDELLHMAMRRLFPEVDLPSAYRDMDAWILQAPKSKRPRDQRKFVINWLRRGKRKEIGAEYKETDGVRCRVNPRNETVIDGAKCRITSADRRTGRA